METKPTFRLNRAMTPKPINIHVGGRVRQRRMELDISIEELANDLNIPVKLMARTEAGLVNIRVRRLYLFSQLLEAPIDYFFDGLKPDMAL